MIKAVVKTTVLFLFYAADKLFIRKLKYMKNTFKKVLLGLGFSLMLLGCGVVKRQQERNDYPLGTSMKISCNIENGKEYQIDSIMTADTLPKLERWLSVSYIDYETNDKIQKRMYIRQYKNGTEAVYIIVGSKEPYKITKRITE